MPKNLKGKVVGVSGLFGYIDTFILGVLNLDNSFNSIFLVSKDFKIGSKNVIKSLLEIKDTIPITVNNAINEY